MEQLEAEVAEIIADLDLYSYYQLLDVSPDAPDSVVTYNYNVKAYAYEQLRRDPRASVDLFQALTVLLDRLAEAQQVLLDKANRADYDRDLAQGHTRHQATVIERARPAEMRSASADDPYLERAARHLEKMLPGELLYSTEEPTEQTTQRPIDRVHLEILTATMSAKLAKAGISLTVREDITQEELSPIDADYLERTVERLEQRLHRFGVDLHDEGEQEDFSAEADYAAELVDELKAELEEMGLDLFDVAEVVDRPPELDEEDEAIVPVIVAAPAPPTLAPRREQLLDEKLGVDVDRLLHQEDEQEERYEEVIRLDEAPGAAPARPSQPRSPARPSRPRASPPARPSRTRSVAPARRARPRPPAPAAPADDVVPVIPLEDDE